jgi:sensor histidine kinase YesM
MVQPLVENAVRHGLEPKVQGGALFIKARMRKENLILWVLDDGIGMSQERLGAIRASIVAALSLRSYEKEKSSVDAGEGPPIPKPEMGGENRLVEGTGIGLVNLATRFGLLYGDKSRFDIVSRSGRGTLVRVVIPVGGAAE